MILYAGLGNKLELDYNLLVRLAGIAFFATVPIAGIGMQDTC